MFDACLLVATVVASSLGTPYGDVNTARFDFTATVAGCGGPAQGAEMASGRVIGHVCAVVQASSGLVARNERGFVPVRVPPLALATLHANRPLNIHCDPSSCVGVGVSMRVAVVFAPTKLEIAGMRARRHAEQADGRLDVRQERQFVAWFEQVLRHERGRIDLATLVHLAVVVDPVKVQVRLVRGKLRLQLLRQCGVFL